MIDVSTKRIERQVSKDAKVRNAKKYGRLDLICLFFPTFAFLASWRSFFFV